jgi:hypothetical protein
VRGFEGSIKMTTKPAEAATGNNTSEIKTSLQIWGAFLSLLGSLPFFIFFTPGWNFLRYPKEYIWQSIAILLNASIGVLHGRMLEKSLTSAPPGDGVIAGAIQGIIKGMSCGFWVGLFTAVSLLYAAVQSMRVDIEIFMIVAAIGIIIGLVLGTLFGGIAGAVFASVIRRKRKAAQPVPPR